ncbi:MAG: TonB-dependent receptor [Prevotella sp.]|nr:TonB-dependent receptor [Prevotella sp.]
MKEKFLICLASLMLMAVSAMAQIKISGTVVSESDGEPLVGATVKVVGTNSGTITDIDGHFAVTVPSAGSRLSVSYIGFKTAEVAAVNNMTVKLKDGTDLDEVVVTGYQVQRKADLTGAVSVMDMKEPISAGEPNMLNSMQGKLSGVNIVTDAAPGGGGTTIRVRGISTVNSSDPLFVIDGVATTENLNSLNAADIESIQVLKDASSASIYGSRAANGVIVITTKKGKNGKTKFNVDYTASVNTVAKTYDMMNAEQWGVAYWQACANDGTTPDSRLYGTGATPKLVDSYNGIKTADTDWQKEVYSAAWTHNISASVSNASDKGSYLFSGNYINQQGLMKYSYYSRFSGRVNSSYNVNKYFHVGENLMVANWHDRGFGTGSDSGIPYVAMRQHPALPVYSSEGVFGSAMQLLSSDVANPMQTLYNGRDNSNNSWRIFGNAYAELIPVKGLTLKTNFGIEHIQYFNKSLGRKVEPTDKNSVSRGYGQGDTYTWTNTANYLGQWGKHGLNALFGVEAIKYVFEGLSAYRDTYAFEDKNYMQIDSGTGTQTNGGGKSEWALFSLFGKVDYNYADRYLASFTLRRDETSRLDKSNRSGVFPAFSGAWRISEESFFPKQNVVNDLKLRVGWGQNGNAAISNLYAGYSTYAYTSGNGSYDLNGTNNSEVSGVIVTSSGNKNLKWETTTQTNLGLDATLFGNAVTLSLDYYWKKTTDMLTVPPTLSVAGENAAKYMNTGTMKNKGFEMNLGYHSPKYGDFSWDGSLNLSAYRNKLVAFNDKVSYQGGDIRIMEGQPMGVYYGWVYDGIFKDQESVANHADQSGKAVGRMIFRDINGDGVVNDNDRCIIGDPNPDWSMGVNLSASWKNFTLSTFLFGEFGFDIYNSTKKQLYLMSYGNLYTNRSTDVLNAWSESNPNASIPALSLNDNNNEVRMSTYYIEDGSYLKMKFLKLAYNFDQNLVKKLGLGGLSVYGQVENVFTITGYSGLDPEVPLGAYGSRVDNGPYPRARTFSLGLHVEF